jgi:hypothetical protein
MKSSKCKLSDKTRNLIFNEFNSIQKKMYKSSGGFTAARRFAEPRKSGYGYRCKWWFFSLNPFQLFEIQKSLPKGWTIECSDAGPGFSPIPSIIVRTNKYPN